MDPDIQFADDWYEYLSNVTEREHELYTARDGRRTPVRLQKCELDNSASIRVVMETNARLPPYFKERPRSSIRPPSGRPQQRPKTAMASFLSYEDHSWKSPSPYVTDDSPRVTFPQHVINTFDAADYVHTIQSNNKPLTTHLTKEADQSQIISILKGRKIPLTPHQQINENKMSHLRPKSAMPCFRSQKSNKFAALPQAPPTSPSQGRQNNHSRNHPTQTLIDEDHSLTNTSSPRYYTGVTNSFTPSLSRKNRTLQRPGSVMSKGSNLETWMSQIRLHSQRSRATTAHMQIHSPFTRNRPKTVKIYGVRTSNSMWSDGSGDPEWIMQSLTVKHVDLQQKPDCAVKYGPIKHDSFPAARKGVSHSLPTNGNSHNAAPNYVKRD